MSLPWENYLAVLELLSLVCSSAFPRGTLSTCLSGTPILGSGHVLLYPLDTVPTDMIGERSIIQSFTLDIIIRTRL